MSQQQGKAKGDALQRLGNLGFIIGGVSLIIFNALGFWDVTPDSI